MADLIVSRLCYLHWGPFSFEIPAGTCLGLSGPSGAGKTLLLRSVADLDPHQGTIKLDGQDADSMDAPAWRRRVSLLPAESQWWMDTVGEHFSEPPDGSLLGSLGFEPDALNWEISRLSVGERQRLALIRVLTREPQALLLDEPTANLDNGNSERVEHLLNSYREKRQVPILWVGHDDNQLARVADRRLHIEDGRLEEVTP